MKTVDYKEFLHERLKNAEYAAEYLAEVLAKESYSTFLIALRDVVEARSEGIVAVAEATGMTRQALHRLMSEDGNPRLSSLSELLNSLGLQISVRSLENEEEAEAA